MKLQFLVTYKKRNSQPINTPVFFLRQTSSLECIVKSKSENEYLISMEDYVELNNGNKIFFMNFEYSVTWQST